MTWNPFEQLTKEYLQGIIQRYRTIIWSNSCSILSILRRNEFLEASLEESPKTILGEIGGIIGEISGRTIEGIPGNIPAEISE